MESERSQSGGGADVERMWSGSRI